jgi:ATP-dependent Zn protease
VKLLTDRAYDHCAKILKENEQKLCAVVEFLLENETMSGKQFVQCMKGETIEGGSSTAMFDDFTETEE